MSITNKINKKPFLGIIAFILVLLTMPIGHAMMILTEIIFGESFKFYAAAILGLIGFILIIIGMKKKREITQTLYGFFAAIFIWTGWVEFSFVFYANHLNIPPLIENGEIVTKPEYLILPSSIGLFFATFIYFLFNGKTQCNFFNWLHRNLKMDFIKKTAPSPNRSFVIITAIETTYILWVFYILLLLIYDKNIFGDYHPVTYVVFFGSLILSLYLFLKLLKKERLAHAFRYAIPTVIIFWNSVEILGRWGFFKEFWIQPLEYIFEMSLIIIAFIIIILVSFFSTDRKRKAIT